MTENGITGVVVDACVQIHKELGPGMLESAYEAVLAYELELRGLKIQRQVPMSLIWKDMLVKDSFRADIVVEGKVILELKSVDMVLMVHKKQVLTYLKVSGLTLGLLLNFGEEIMKHGIVRLVNGLEE